MFQVKREPIRAWAIVCVNRDVHAVKAHRGQALLYMKDCSGLECSPHRIVELIEQTKKVKGKP